MFPLEVNSLDGCYSRVTPRSSVELAFNKTQRTLYLEESLWTSVKRLLLCKEGQQNLVFVDCIADR